MEELTLTQVGVIVLLTNFAKDLVNPFLVKLTDNGRLVATSLLVLLVSALVYYGQVVLAMLPPGLQAIMVTGMLGAGGWSTVKRLKNGGTANAG